MDIRILYKDRSFVQVIAENHLIMELRDYFSFDVEGAKFNRKYRYGGWDGKIRMLDNNGQLPYGLVDRLYKYAIDNDYSISVDSQIASREILSDEQFKRWTDSKELYDGATKIDFYDYQYSSILFGINNQRAILNLPTSAGKSLIQAGISRWYLENNKKKVLILVPTTALTIQMKDDFCNYRLFKQGDILQIMSKTKRDSDTARVYVSTWQTSIKQPKEWFDQFGLLLVDEMHLANAKSLTSIITGMDNCEFKIGLTGSLKEGKANLLQYVGLFGKIFKPITTKELIDSGRASKLKINCVLARYEDDVCRVNKGIEYSKEIEFITGYARRNAFVCKLALKLAQKKENTVIMFHHKKHGKLLFNALSKKHDKVYFIDGDTETEIRDQTKKLAENEQGMIIIASLGVFSTGISIKNLHHVIFTHPRKSSVTVKQTIGRILRLHASKNVATMWDIIDDMGIKTKSPTAKKKYSHKNYAMEHGLMRIKVYNEEKFDYSILNTNL